MPYDGRFVAVGVYAHVATLLLPVVCRTGVGAVWGVRKRSYPAEFIAMLATVVNMLALVFHSLMTTRLDNAQLLGVGSATLLGLAVAAVFSGIALRSLHIASAHARARGYVSQHRQPRASRRATGVRGHRARGRILCCQLFRSAHGRRLCNEQRRQPLAAVAERRHVRLPACSRAARGRSRGRHATVDRLSCRCAGDPPYQSAAATGRRDDTAIRHAGRGRQLHLRVAVQHLRRRGGRRGAGVDCSVRGAVSAAHLAGERKAVLIRGWCSPASPHA